MIAPRRVLSLGGGVQSTVLALMSADGVFGVVPDCAIFADTRWEWPETYSNIEWLSRELPYPVFTVNNGRSLREDVKSRTSLTRTDYIDIPVFLKGRNGQRDGMGRRQCTENFKIRPIRKRIRELLGVGPRRRVPVGTTVEMWLGISTDEADRQRDSRDRWIVNRYPLIEAGLSRRDCAEWFTRRYDRPLVRSACVACPFQSRRRWVELKRRWPALFAETVEIDRSLRSSLALVKEAYLHRRRLPLKEAVVLDEAVALGETLDGGDGFGNDCSGHCGV